MVTMRAIRLITALTLGLCFSTFTFPQDKLGGAIGSAANGRYLAVISDLHMGIGRNNDGKWHPGEDFRWPNALRSFLDELSLKGNHAVDLVIAGDLVELWQPPEHIKCVGVSADLGCKISEMVEIAEIVAHQHATELGLLANFAERGDNRVYIIPGNHDSTFLLSEVWEKFSGPLRNASGRVSLVQSGIWVSADGKVVIEHGHQIGADVNQYKAWPEVVRTQDGVTYVVRPWGERFVQRIFNEQESDYPIIDNLSPETAGIRYRMADRGVWGTAVDMAKFLVFNVFETSSQQKVSVLGAPGPGEDEATKWRMDVARSSGHRLIVAALPANDPFRIQLLSDDANAKAVRDELDKLMMDASPYISDSEIHMLCDMAASESEDGWQLCRPASLSALYQTTLVPINSVLRQHLKKRIHEPPYRKMIVFIYGHTHQMISPKNLPITSIVDVTWLNSGAFQRLVNEDGFLKRVKDKSWSVQEGLKNLKPEDLAPCYGVVLVPYENNVPRPKTKMWWFPEDAQKGKFISQGDKLCQ